MRTTGFVIVAIATMLAPRFALSGGDARSELDAFFAAEWDYAMQQSPLVASALGDTRFGDRLDDLSLSATRARQQHDRDALAVLRAMDSRSLDARRRESYVIFLDRLQLAVDGMGFPEELMPITQLSYYSVPLSMPTRFEQSVPRTAKQYSQQLERLAQVPRAIAQVESVLEEGVRRGITPPRVPLERVEAQLRAIAGARPEDSQFFAPFLRIPPTIPVAERERLRQAGLAVVRDVVLPAYAHLADFWASDYYPNTRETIALSALPDGMAWYTWTVRKHTTTDLSPREIHEIGLAEVKRIHAEMLEQMRQTGFEGTLEEFFTLLRTDRRFYNTDPSQLLRSYRDICKRIDARLPELFGRLPRLPYGVAAIPEHLSPASPTAYYDPGSPDAGRAGFLYANTDRLETRPTWEMELLSLHEAVPGHHLQVALAQEMEGLPRFRSVLEISAYAEGWGLYSESLGDELGLYTDPYARFGRLSAEMWRAARLVVDTGIHAFGWSRQQSIDYLLRNTGRHENDIAVEVDRYIVLPGQALAYKIGELKLQRLRAEAEGILGQQFDIRAFHDVVLGSGAVPLAMLEKNVRAWVTARCAEVRCMR